MMTSKLLSRFAFLSALLAFPVVAEPELNEAALVPASECQAAGLAGPSPCGPAVVVKTAHTISATEPVG